MDIFSDGGARGNPGPAACAFVVIAEGKVIYREGKFLGKMTNNQAEYNGVLLALNWLADSGAKNLGSGVSFYVDSELIANQVNGNYKVKDQKLKELFSMVQNLLKRIPDKIFFKNIPRSKNKLADFLVNETLDNERNLSFTSSV